MAKQGLLTAGVIALLPLLAGAMERVSLDGLWDFSFAEGATIPDAKSAFTASDKMPVPCCFDLTPRYYMKRGTAHYRREKLAARKVRELFALENK